MITGHICSISGRIIAQQFNTLDTQLLNLLFSQIPWVRIQTRQRKALSNKRILVALDSWPAWCRYPLGHYVKTVGEKGVKATETEVVAHQTYLTCLW